jgi:fibronectin-binding autotransporter adhesin
MKYALGGLGIMGMASSALLAADFTWLDAPASANWNETDTNWTGAASVWTSVATNSAIFGASGTQTIAAGPVTLSNLTFNADGYMIGGGSLLMYGSPTVGAGQTATLNAAVTNVGVWTKNGAGTLTLAAGAGVSNIFYALKAAAGTLCVNSGTTLVTQADSNPESGPAFWVSGGTLVVGGGLLKTTAGPYARVSEYGTLLVTNGVCDLSSNGELLNAFNSPGTTTVGGNGMLIVDRFRIVKNQVGASYSVVNVNTGGTIQANEFEFETDAQNGNPNRKATFNLNGGKIVARDKATTRDLLGIYHPYWTNILVNVLAGGAIFDNNGCNFTVIAKLRGSPNDGGLTKQGSGTLYLKGTNTYNGATVLKGGTLNIYDDQNLGAVPSSPSTNVWFLADSTLQSGDNHALDANRTLLVSTNVTVTVDTQSYTQKVSGVITGLGKSWLTKSGNGMLILNPGENRTNSISTLRVSAGTVYITGGTTEVTTNGPGTINIGLDINGGALLVGGGRIRTTGSGYWAVKGMLTITNGIVDCSSSSEMLNAFNGAGTTTVSQAGILDVNICRIAHGDGWPITGNVINVNTGGTFRLTQFAMDFKYNAKGLVNFNGGTLVAKANTSEFLGSATNIVGNDNNDKWLTNVFVYVREGGATFDTNGKIISIKQPLYTGAPVDGGLIKRGAGMLTLLNTNTYNGATSVEGGTLKLGVATNTLFTGGSAFVSSNAVFDVNGTVQPIWGLGGSGTVTNNSLLTVTGAVMPGGTNVIGTLTLASACSLSGEFRVDVATNGVCDRLYVQGDLSVTNLALKVADTGLLNENRRYVIASCSGAVSGPFASAALPRRWFVQYDAANRRVYLIYNRGTALTLR